MDKCGERAGSHRCDLAPNHHGPHYNIAAQHLWYPDRHWLDKPERDIRNERETCASIAAVLIKTIGVHTYGLTPMEAAEFASVMVGAINRNP